MARCEGAVAPKNTFTEEDVRAGTDTLAQWLTGLTGDAVNWRAVITVGEMLPVAGSIFAAADAIGDIIELAQGDATYRADLYNWVGLGINMFGLVPLPGVGAARAVMRPSLKTIRTTKGDISQALLTTIESALADISRRSSRRLKPPCKASSRPLHKRSSRFVISSLTSSVQWQAALCRTWR